MSTRGGSNGGNLARHLFSSVVILLATRVTGLILQVLVFLLITRLLPIADVGIYAVINAVWLLVRMLAPLGLDQASMRFVPTYLARDQAGYAADLEARARRTVALVGTTLAAAIGAGGMGLEALSVAQLSPTVYVTIAVAVPAYALIGLFVGQLRARQLSFWSQFPESVVLPLGLGVGLIAAALSDAASLESTLLAQAASAWLALGVYLTVHGRHRLGLPTPMLAEERREIRKMARGVFLTLSVTGLAARLPVIIVSAVLGPAATAIMETAHRFGLLPTLATWAVGASVSPMLSSTHARGEWAQRQKLFTLGSWLAFIPAFGILAILAVFGQWFIVNFVGVAYEAAYWPMLVICGANVVNASAGLALNLYFMTGHERTVLIFSVAEFAMVIVGVTVLSAVIGVTGAGVAILLGTIFRDIGMNMLLRRYLDMHSGVWSWQGLRSVRRIAAEVARQGLSAIRALF